MSVTISHEGTIAIATIDNPPVNAAGHSVREGIFAAVTQLDADPKTEAVVLICAGRTFVAGADVREFGHPPKTPHLPDVIKALEAAAKPWVAAIHGTALGGGLEIALGCHYRVAIDSAKLGLPEVNLGLIPGAGGTVRLPRLIAAPDALEIITSGKPISAAKAYTTGLLDHICNNDLQQAAIDVARSAAKSPLPKPVSQRAPKLPEDAAAWDTQKDKIRRKARGAIAPLAAIGAVQNALEMTGEDALAYERDTFLELKSGPQSAALRHAFFAERAASKVPGVSLEDARDIQQIGVVGGGTMGAGIAAACLLAGFQVVLVERNADALDLGRSRIETILSASQTRGVITVERYKALQNALSGAISYDALSNAQLVIEAVFEDMGVKKDVFTRLEAATHPDAILATNTSYLDVNDIASALQTPSRVIGLHFFSPAHIMKLLELVIPEAANPSAIATGLKLGKALRKIVVPAGVCDGFIGNRIMSRYRQYSDQMLIEGALPEQIDAAMKAFGFPMGVFEMQDMAGLDIAWAMRKRRTAETGMPPDYIRLADMLCEAGRFGRKTGRGWYLYDDPKSPRSDPEVAQMIQEEATRLGVSQKNFTADQIMDRIIGVMQDEGVRILDEGIARSPDDIDVVMINGYAFPRWRGGPMFMKHRSAL